MDKLLLKLNQRYNTTPRNRYTPESIAPYINDINWSEYTNDDLDEVLEYFHDKINHTDRPKTALAIDSVFGERSYSKIKNKIAPGSVYSYVILDSKYRDLSYPAADGTLSFSYQLINAAGGQGIVSSTNETKDIKSITLLKPTIPATTYTDFNHRNVNITIKEISTQSYIISETQKAHFIIKASDVYISGYNVLDFDDESFNGVENKFIFNFPIGTLIK